MEERRAAGERKAEERKVAEVAEAHRRVEAMQAKKEADGRRVEESGCGVVYYSPHFVAFLCILMHSAKFHCILFCCIPDLLHAYAFICILTYS